MNTWECTICRRGFELDTDEKMPLWDKYTEQCTEYTFRGYNTLTTGLSTLEKRQRK